MKKYALDMYQKYQVKVGKILMRFAKAIIIFSSFYGLKNPGPSGM